MESTILPKVDEVSIGTLAETFWDAPYQGPAFAISFGVPQDKSGKTLEILSEIARKKRTPGIFAMRFIKKSEATLSFARFDKTCMIEIDGVLWNEKKNLGSLNGLSREMMVTLHKNNIPFTLHWGKNADWEFVGDDWVEPTLADYMYKEDAKTWRSYRSSLLSADMQKLFSNRFLKECGLDATELVDNPADLIASLI